MCKCDAPWHGNSCETISFATTPASGKNVYTVPSPPSNTWNGPIVGPESDGLYHIYVPLYKASSLAGAKVIKHGIASHPAGPYAWGELPDIPSSINPAFLIYPDDTTNPGDGGGEPKMVYSLWTADGVMTASGPNGTFTPVPNFQMPDACRPWEPAAGCKATPQGNPAPIFHKGAFYLATQHTGHIWTTQSIAPGSTWTLFANISLADVPHGARPEDPFMWIVSCGQVHAERALICSGGLPRSSGQDKRGNWHIINHAYDTSQKTQCGNSTLSTHFFSSDGRNWRCGPRNPYGHVVHFDDGTKHTYTTLERPNIHFDAHGQMDYLSLAADLVTGDEGCAPTPCTNCKYKDPAGTLVVKLCPVDESCA